MMYINEFKKEGSLLKEFPFLEGFLWEDEGSVEVFDLRTAPKDKIIRSTRYGEDEFAEMSVYDAMREDLLKISFAGSRTIYAGHVGNAYITVMLEEKVIAKAENDDLDDEIFYCYTIAVEEREG